MSISFVIGFAIFLVLMAGLFVVVVRFALQQGLRRTPPGESPPAPKRPESDLDEPSASALVDDPDERRDN
jgi:hypothetical protein